VKGKRQGFKVIAEKKKARLCPSENREADVTQLQKVYEETKKGQVHSANLGRAERTVTFSGEKGKQGTD